MTEISLGSALQYLRSQPAVVGDTCHFDSDHASQSTDSTGSLNATNIITSRWWEKDGCEILKTSDNFHEVGLVLKFSLFQDTKVPLQALAGRQGSWLRAFLCNLLGIRDDAAVHENDGSWTANEIFRLCRQANSLSHRATDWSWILTDIASQVSATEIGEKLDAAMSLAFVEVPLHFWVRHLLGYKDVVASEFFNALSNSRNDFSQYLQELGLARSKWEELSEKVQTPLAQWMISTSLRSYEASPDPIDALFPIFDPIQELFTTPHHNLIPLLERLAFLAEKSKYKLLRQSDRGFLDIFSTNFSFLDYLSAPEDFAKSITNNDDKLFQCISYENILDPSQEHLRTLGRQSSNLSDDVAACITISSSWLPHTIKLAEALVKLKNYHSAGAVGSGLEKADPLSAAEWPIWKVISPENNFATLRALSAESHTLSYLPPVVHKLQQLEGAKEQVYMKYLGENPDSLEGAVEVEKALKKGDKETWVGVFGSKRMKASNNHSKQYHSPRIADLRAPTNYENPTPDLSLNLGNSNLFPPPPITLTNSKAAPSESASLKRKHSSTSRDEEQVNAPNVELHCQNPNISARNYITILRYERADRSLEEREVECCFELDENISPECSMKDYEDVWAKYHCSIIC
ncbi:hypothetical protein G7Y89_g2732 [Cudoniella acicularis]|uniref:Uncharacterized protein n=1 Tax=Cudoniella acicularis TaxID=354080 RepID=A0A8H4RVR6_9HELO|nr:hypothetical protein G7Y89_g2732 [Cudoniella acicularis]